MKLSNGVEPTGRSQPVATKSLIARNRSHTRKRAPVGAIFASALAAEPRPRQHLTLQQFLAPLTARRCPLLGNYSSAVQFLRWCRRSPRRLVCSLLGRFHRPPGRSIPSETEVRSAVFTVPI